MEWRQIPEYPDYEISEIGHVRRSLDPKWGRKAGRSIASYIDPKMGYVRYTLRKDGIPHLCQAGALVLFAFVGPRPTPVHQAAHWDGVASNNHHSNLRWATCAENLADRWRHGTMTIGQANGRAKLTEEMIGQMRRLRAEGMSFAKIGKKFGVSKRQSMRVIKGQQWPAMNAPDHVANQYATGPLFDRSQRVGART